jgi:plastocyanin
VTVRLRASAMAVALLAIGTFQTAAQSLLQRTPNLQGGWTGAHGTVYFNFLHRFQAGDAPARQVTNFPTFLIGAGAPGNILLAAHYATRSDLVPAYPNEWEFFARAMPLKQTSGFPLDVALQGGYNLAAESFDGELTLARLFGPLRLMAVGRGMTKGYGVDESRFAIAGGAVVNVTRSIALAADAGRLFEPTGNLEKIAWGAGLQLAIPYTPHTFSLQVTNTNTATVQGATRGQHKDLGKRYGFEFTVPFTLSRYFGRRPAAAADAGAGVTTNVVRMREMRFEPARVQVSAGSTVTWRNDDQVVHTVKAADGSWESPLMQPGQTYQHTFANAGQVEIICGPHPFMKSVVEVR